MKRWTQAEEDKLVTLATGKLSGAEIAEFFPGRTRDMIFGKALRMNKDLPDDQKLKFSDDKHGVHKGNGRTPSAKTQARNVQATNTPANNARAKNISNTTPDVQLPRLNRSILSEFETRSSRLIDEVVPEERECVWILPEGRCQAHRHGREQVCSVHKALSISPGMRSQFYRANPVLRNDVHVRLTALGYIQPKPAQIPAEIKAEQPVLQLA